MDFFERQDHARRNTRLLIAYFITGVTLLVLSVYLILLLILAFYQPETRSRAGGIDLAVHSLKDLPAKITPGLAIRNSLAVKPAVIGKGPVHVYP